MNFIAELKRRNVIRMAGLYLVGAWLVTQVAGTLLPMFEAPGWIARGVVVLLAIGLVPALVFAWVFELTPQGLKRDADVSRSESIAPQTTRRLDRLLLIVAALAIGYFAFDKFVLAPRREAAVIKQVREHAATDARAQAVSSIANSIPSKSIAVLPLTNEGADKDEQYFSDGLSENLITALSQFDGLKVISRNSAFQFRDTKDSSRAIGEKLGVAHLLEGSVRRLGDTVRINATLVLARDGRTVWSEHYDRPYRDLFKLQDDITAAVAAALKARLIEPTRASAQSERPPGGDLVAYNAYLQGQFHAALRTPEDFVRAFYFFAQATTRDPNYAQAWAAYASAKILDAAIFLGGRDAQTAVVEARHYVDRALALAPQSAYVQASDSRVLSNGELRFVDAERAARRAVELDPTADSLGELALSRAWLGDARGAESLQHRASDLDPLNGAIWFWRSTNLAGQGRLDEAQQAAERAIELSPGAAIGHAQRAIVEVLRGNRTRALALADAVPAGSWRNIAVALASQGGNDAAGDRALETLIGESADGSAYQIAEVYALRRDPDRMFEWLDRAWRNRDPGLRRLLADPFIAPYRADPRLAAFCRTIGLPTPAV